MNFNLYTGAPNGKIADGSNPYARAGNSNELITGELHGAYYETTYRRNMFSAANTAAVATTAIAATTYTGLCLSNSIGSGVNLVLINAGWATSAAISAAAALVLQTGFNASSAVTHTAAVTPVNNFLNGPSGLGLVDSSATLPTAPTARVALAGAGTLAVGSYGLNPAGLYEAKGSIVIPPGGYVSFATSAANTAAWWFSFTWEEVPA